MEIVAIAESDLELVSQLYVDVFSNPPWNEHWEYNWAYERLNWVYRSQGFMGFVARNGDRILGAIFGYSAPFQGKKGLIIVEFFVSNDYQNRGIGTRLLKEIELELKSRKYNFISLLTNEDSSAKSFYLKHNFKRDNKLIFLRREI